MAPRKTAYNKKWKDKYPWISPVKDDSDRALCTLCNSKFKISSKGEGSVKEHADGDSHKKNEKKAKFTQPLDRFLVRIFLLLLLT